MATSTTKLGLIKPDFVDVVDITDLNSNADDIDAAVGFTICTNATRPASPYTGQSIFETDTGDSFIWDGSAWQPGGGGGSIEISATAPASPAAGDLWWDSDNGNLYIYYDDGDSQQWVAANGPQVFVGAAAPPGYQGQLWFDSTTGKVYIYYDDGTSAQWVSAIGGSLSGNVIQVVTASYAVQTTTSSLSFVPTGLNATITPKFATSKILVLHTGTGGRDINAAANTAEFTLFRGDTSTGTNLGSSVGLLQIYDDSVDGSRRLFGSLAMSVADSPATTSAVTYTAAFKIQSGVTAIAQRASSPSTLILMEVAA